MLSFASEADIPPVLRSTVEESPPGCTDDGDGALGFHDTGPGFGRGTGAGPGVETFVGFSKAAILSRKEPGLGFAGGDG